MKGNSKTQMKEYLEKRIVQCKAQEQRLAADERKSEAIFARVQTNVYDIFKTMLAAGEKAAGGDEEKLKLFFMQKLEQIPQNWHAAFAEAKAHGDVEKEHIERLKLEVVEEIRTEAARLWEA